MVIVGAFLGPPGVAAVGGRAGATTVTDGYVGGKGEGEIRVQSEGTGIRKEKAEEFVGREERRGCAVVVVEEFEFEGDAGDASHGV